MIIQLCMAGQAIVGWYTPPPTFIEPKLSSWPVGDLSIKPNRAGSFVVDTRFLGDNGWTMWWDFGERFAVNSKDPHQLLIDIDKFNDKGGTKKWEFGYFRIEKGGDADVIAVRFDHLSKEHDRFKRYRPSSRIPNTLMSAIPIDQITNFLEDSYLPSDLCLVEHIQPFPPSWIAETLNSLVGPAAASLINEWQGISPHDRIPRKLKRAKIAKQIGLTALEKGNLSPAHRGALLSRIKATLMTTMHEVKGKRRSFYEWYTDALIEEADSLEPKGSSSREVDSFKRLGVVPPQNQIKAYVFSYYKIDKSFNADGIHASGAAFILKIRKLIVELDLDASGKRQYNADNVPLLKNPELLDDESKGITFGEFPNVFAGLFGDVGVGIGISWDFGNPIKKASPKIKGAGGNILGGALFLSDYDLKADDFQLAWFRISAIKGPSAEVGGVGSADAISSTLHEYFLKDGRSLESIATRSLETSGLDLPKWDLIFKGKAGVKDHLEKLQHGKASATLGDFTVGFGFIVHRGTETTRKVPLVPPKEKTGAVHGSAYGRTLFDYDKAHFRTGSDINKDGRYLLECWLATMRVRFTESMGLINVDGLTSPEGSHCYNYLLSEARAHNVKQGILDAFSGAIDPRRIVTTPRGEIPALKSGLVDPPEDPVKLKEYKQSPRNRDIVEKQWPEWRRVEVTMDGETLITGYVDEDKFHTP